MTDRYMNPRFLPDKRSARHILGTTTLFSLPTVAGTTDVCLFLQPRSVK